MFFRKATPEDRFHGRFAMGSDDVMTKISENPVVSLRSEA
jgi:hypothetical protein